MRAFDLDRDSRALARAGGPRSRDGAGPRHSRPAATIVALPAGAIAGAGSRVPPLSLADGARAAPPRALRGPTTPTRGASTRVRAPPRRSMALREPEAARLPAARRPAARPRRDRADRGGVLPRPVEAGVLRERARRSRTATSASSPARTGGAPRVGGYLFAVSLYDEFHINKIATDPRLRQQGYGRMLLEDALARARAVGPTAVTLEVRVSNAAGPRVLPLLRLSRRPTAAGPTTRTARTRSSWFCRYPRGLPDG